MPSCLEIPGPANAEPVAKNLASAEDAKSILSTARRWAQQDPWRLPARLPPDLLPVNKSILVSGMGKCL